MSVPVIDVEGVRGGEADRRRVGEALLDAYGSLGFAQIVGHGLDADLIAAVFELSAQFHALPIEHKLAIELDRNHRGYLPIAASTDRRSRVAEVTGPNHSASFLAMRDAGPDDPDVAGGVYLAGPNLWPDLDGFRASVEAYAVAAQGLGRAILATFALALDDHEGRIASSLEPPTWWLRLLHYPPQARGPDERYGSAPHVDFGAITLLAQDTVGGLQVLRPGGRWTDVEPRRDALVMNTGEMLHRWSNGRLLATPHRVINPAGPPRLSVAYFLDPHMTTTVEPLRGCVSDEDLPRFEPVVFGDHVRAELESGYIHHGAR